MTSFFPLLLGYQKSTQAFWMCHIVYFNNMKRNLRHLSCTRGPPQPKDYELNLEKLWCHQLSSSTVSTVYYATCKAHRSLCDILTSDFDILNQNFFKTNRILNWTFHFTGTCQSTLCSEKTPTHIFFHISMSDVQI